MYKLRVEDFVVVVIVELLCFFNFLPYFCTSGAMVDAHVKHYTLSLLLDLYDVIDISLFPTYSSVCKPSRTTHWHFRLRGSQLEESLFKVTGPGAAFVRQRMN